MKTPPVRFSLLCAALLVAGGLQPVLAGPAPAGKTVAAKPKFAPRAVPGMSNHDPNTEPAGDHARAYTAPTRAAVARTSSAPSAASSAAAAAPTRILMIYRRGTVELPPAPQQAPAVIPASLSTPLPAAEAQARPATFTPPPPGVVRIVSKAEADAIAAQVKSTPTPTTPAP